MCHSAKTLVYSESCIEQQTQTLQDAFKLLKIELLFSEWSLHNIDNALNITPELMQTFARNVVEPYNEVLQHLGVHLNVDNVEHIALLERI